MDNGIQHLEKEDLKRDAKKPGLYRFLFKRNLKICTIIIYIYVL